MADKVRILQITDTHLHASREARMRGVNTLEAFEAIVERIIRDNRQPDIIIATGDLVQDETRQGYEIFRDTIKVLDTPVHCIPGNHDSQRIMEEILNDEPFYYCGVASLSNWQIVMLNSVIRLDDGGALAPEELQRLDDVLSAHPEQNVLLCMHHHPLPMGSLWLDGVNLRNSDDLFAVVNQHKNVRGMVWGHVHQCSDREHLGMRMISTPATGSQFLPGSDVFKMDTKPPGYRWIGLLPDGRIETEVIWLD